jgi:hypothetical protein
MPHRILYYYWRRRERGMMISGLSAMLLRWAWRCCCCCYCLPPVASWAMMPVYVKSLVNCIEKSLEKEREGGDDDVNWRKIR